MILVTIFFAAAGNSKTSITIRGTEDAIKKAIELIEEKVKEYEAEKAKPLGSNRRSARGLMNNHNETVGFWYLISRHFYLNWERLLAIPVSECSLIMAWMCSMFSVAVSRSREAFV